MDGTVGQDLWRRIGKQKQQNDFGADPPQVSADLEVCESTDDLGGKFVDSIGFEGNFVASTDFEDIFDASTKDFDDKFVDSTEDFGGKFVASTEDFRFNFVDSTDFDGTVPSTEDFRGTLLSAGFASTECRMTRCFCHEVSRYTDGRTLRELSLLSASRNV